MGSVGIPTSLSSWSTDSTALPVTPSGSSSSIDPELRTLRNKCTALERRRVIECKEHRVSKYRLQQEVFQLESQAIELESKIANLEDENCRIKDELAFFTRRFYGPDA